MNGFATLYHNPFNKWVHVICSGKLTSDDFQQALFNGLSVLKANHCHDLILDCRLAYDAVRILTWVDNDWIAAAGENGLERIAFVYGTPNAEILNQEVWARRITFYPCHSLSSAVKWLTQKE
jgi:hypothetical protein